VVHALPELGLIADSRLRQATAEVWLECWAESNWARLEDAAKSPHLPASLGLVLHTRGVVGQSLAAAESAHETHGVGFNRDVLVAGALLHDVSKLVEWEPGPAGPVPSSRGRLLQHAVYAAHKALAKGVPDEVVHIVVSHTPQSGLAPQTWECQLVRSADLLDSAALERVADASPNG
jgi:putative nucleotidyltransferase with HDIG domain